MPRNQEERLYFIVRAYLMGCVGGIIFPLIVFILGSINFIQTIVIGFFVFVASLVISRAFESYIERATRKILSFLDRNRRIKRFILKYF